VCFFLGVLSVFFFLFSDLWSGVSFVCCFFWFVLVFFSFFCLLGFFGFFFWVFCFCGFMLVVVFFLLFLGFVFL